MSPPWDHMHFDPDGFAKFNKGLRSCLPVFLSNMHLNVVKERLINGFASADALA
jgi:hypothetical protein